MGSSKAFSLFRHLCQEVTSVLQNLLDCFQPPLPKEPISIHSSTPAAWAITPGLIHHNEIIALQVQADLWFLLLVSFAAWCLGIQALQKGIQLCWFPRLHESFPTMLSCGHVFIYVHTLGIGSFYSCLVDYEIPCGYSTPYLLSVWCTTSFGFRSFSLSTVGPSLKQRWFFSHVVGKKYKRMVLSVSVKSMNRFSTKMCFFFFF